MNLLMELKIGDKIEVEPTKIKNTIRSRPIVSQIIDIKDNQVFISNPIKQGMPYQLHPGQQINIIFYRNEKGIYCFLGEVLQRLDLQLSIYIIRPLSSPEKTQRRFYFRLRTLTKVLIESLSDNDEVEGFTKDISGGGLKIFTKKAFHENEKVKCTIFLDNNECTTALGEIVRVEKESATNEYQVVVRYVEITDSNRNKIIAFIFKKQRELRQKGLI